MLTKVGFLVLSVLEGLGIILFTLKLYMLPLKRWHFKQVAILVICMTFFSYLMRVVFNLSVIDLPLQYVIYVLFSRYVFGIRMHLASFMWGASLSAYAMLQMLIYYCYDILGLLQVDVFKQSTGVQISLLQASSIVMLYTISFFLKFTGRGFSFIADPPHDFFSPTNFSESPNMQYVIVTLISTVTIVSAVFLLANVNPLGLLIVSLFTFTISYLFSKRKDAKDAMDAIEAYRERNKKD
ncbi:hypothetical protein ACFQ5D_03085 [Paenibacillus farraposensis]|uniref:Uncharacterized protein n=1 Tax=Paenibacillus farraposensis TaxID=2807095 RepID=A0ABW4D6W3_9BACL|nr:hypothetical protein [Paenibacillus farraposensis]MCC3381874.1 hypothetical protein [Paenibacillus farraposensis]